MAAIRQEICSRCEPQPEKKYAKIIPIGSSFDFEADDWFLFEYAPKKGGAVKKIHLCFSGILQPQVRLLIKQYALWRLGRVKPATVRVDVSGRLVHFVQYLSERGITDPRQFREQEMRAFGWWLCQKDISKVAAYRTMHTVDELIRTGQRLGWQVTREEVSSDMICRQFLSDAVKKSPAGYARPIPDELYKQILYHALNDEADVITKAGILIQSQTGLRINEILSLQAGCLTIDKSGGVLLTYSLKKTEKAEPVQRCVPANGLVVQAVEELQRATEGLRADSGRRELFLVKNHGIHPASAANWNRGRLRSFLRRWGIRNTDGSEYPLHSHQFRATYVKRQLLAGDSIETVQKRFGHVSPEMTARYVHLMEEELLTLLTSCIEQGGDEIGEKKYAGS